MNAKLRLGATPAAKSLQDDPSHAPEALLEAAIRAVTEALCPQRPQIKAGARADDGRPDLPPLLAPKQAAELIGVSRNTVDRMVEDGELPSIILREGTRQRMVRIPKSFVLQMLRDLDAGAQIVLRDYAAQWSASVATPAAGVPVHRSDAAEVA